MAVGGLPVDLEPILEFVTSPLSSVDATSRDRSIVEEELEKRLKHRVGRQDLVQRNILPPLSLPTAPKLFTNSQQLQRAQNADSLQKKLRNRPDRVDLQQLNILPDLFMNIDPALQAKQVQLLKSKKVDSLNEKLANRPGPIQLIKDRILEPDLASVIEDVEKFSQDEESVSSQAIPAITLQRTASESHQRPSLPRHSIATSTPASSQLTTAGYISPTKELTSPLSSLDAQRRTSDSSLSPTNSPGEGYEAYSPPVPSPRSFTSTYPPNSMSFNPAHTASGILTSGIGKAPSPSQTRKKQKQQKYRKLRYHEYVPPTKSTPKGGKQTPRTPPKSNNPYDLLLQQQQLYLQLQVLQQNGAAMQKLPDLFNTLSKEQKSLALASIKAGIPVSSATTGEMSITLPKQLGASAQLPQIINVETPNKQNITCVRFDDLKVSDLKAACKELGIIVSGKKAELVERLLEANKRLLPPRALPDNTSKDSRRQAFSLGGATSSVDSQLSNPPTSSPSSPTSSPVFTFPSDQHNGRLHHSQSYTTINPQGGPNQPPLRVESMPAMLHEVFPASTLQHEFDEMIQQQKRNYISQKGSMGAKSLAPCPDLNDLVAIKLHSYPSQAPPTYQQSVNTKGTSQRTNELQQTADKFPPSPISELMDDTAAPTPSSHGNVSTSSSLATTSNGIVSGRSHDMFLIPSTPLSMTTPTSGNFTNSLMGGMMMTTGGRGQDPHRPERMSVPENTNKVHPMSPPSYEASVQRSISLSGPVPQLGQLHSASFGSEVAVGGDLTNLHSDGMMDMDVAMDTGQSFSDLMDIIKGDSAGFSNSPQSLPVTLPHHHTLNSHNPHNMSFTNSTKPTPNNIMLGALNTQNHSLQHNKPLNSSDVCLAVPGQDSSRNSLVGSGSYNLSDNVMLGNEIAWLDLENISTGNNLGGFSPSGFPPINSQSNPGSLPNDQFQMQFFDDNTGQISNPSLLNGLPSGGDVGPFLDSSGMLIQSDEKALLELGLSS